MPHTTCMAGEVGLSGEIRPVARLEQRVSEACKLGMERMIVRKGNLKGVDISRFGIEIIEVARVDEAFRTLFA